MPTMCEIEFENNPDKVFNAGQLLRGTVQLILTEQKRIRSIFIRFSGRIVTSWWNLDEVCEHEGIFLIHQSNLVDKRKDEICLLPGTYRYPFECMLQDNLSSSMKGTYGSITYMACVVLEVPIMSNKEFKFPFTVFKEIDLNAIPSLRKPVCVRDDVITFPCCFLCCFSSQSLSVVAKIPVGGYIPGETIPLKLSVYNKSDEPISKFKVQLIKQITYLSFNIASNPSSKTEIFTMSKQETCGCDANHDDIISVNIVIPHFTPINTVDMSVIDVKYEIQIISCDSKVKIHVPIIMGSYPFRDEPTQSFNHSGSFEMPPNLPISKKST